MGHPAEVDAVPVVLQDEFSGGVIVRVATVEQGAVVAAGRVGEQGGTGCGPEAACGEDAVHGGAAECREDEQQGGPAQEAWTIFWVWVRFATGCFAVSLSFAPTHRKERDVWGTRLLGFFYSS